MIYETEVCIHLNDKKVDPTKIILPLRLALHIVTWKFPCRNYFTLQTSTQSPLNWLLVIYISFLRENLHWKNSIKYQRYLYWFHNRFSYHKQTYICMLGNFLIIHENLFMVLSHYDTLFEVSFICFCMQKD